MRQTIVFDGQYLQHSDFVTGFVTFNEKGTFFSVHSYRDASFSCEFEKQ